MFKRILVAFDGSDSAENAFELGVDLTGKYGAALRIVAVVQPPAFSGQLATEVIIEDCRGMLQRLLQPLKELTAKSHLVVEYTVEVGQPAEHILRDAEQWRADLIVLGHRGQGLVNRWLLGSTAMQVMHHAPCAVLVAHLT